MAQLVLGRAATSTSRPSAPARASGGPLHSSISQQPATRTRTCEPRRAHTRRSGPTAVGPAPVAAVGAAARDCHPLGLIDLFIDLSTSLYLGFSRSQKPGLGGEARWYTTAVCSPRGRTTGPGDAFHRCGIMREGRLCGPPMVGRPVITLAPARAVLHRA